MWISPKKPELSRLFGFCRTVENPVAFPQGFFMGRVIHRGVDGQGIIWWISGDAVEGRFFLFRGGYLLEILAVMSRIMSDSSGVVGMLSSTLRMECRMVEWSRSKTLPMSSRVSPVSLRMR